VHDVKGEFAITQARGNQAARPQRRVSLIVAGAAQRHRAIQIEVRAAARALDHMVNVEAATPAAHLAAAAQRRSTTAELPAFYRVRKSSLRRSVSNKADHGDRGCRRTRFRHISGICSGEVTDGHRYFAGP
jgi:hypothetical protein